MRVTEVTHADKSHTRGRAQRASGKGQTADNSQRVYKHLHGCDEEENQHAAAEGGAAPLLLLGGEVLLELRVHEAQRHGVDLVILHSGRNITRRVIGDGRRYNRDGAVLVPFFRSMCVLLFTFAEFLSPGAPAAVAC